MHHVVQHHEHTPEHHGYPQRVALLQEAYQKRCLPQKTLSLFAKVLYCPKIQKILFESSRPAPHIPNKIDVVGQCSTAAKKLVFLGQSSTFARNPTQNNLLSQTNLSVQILEPCGASCPLLFWFLWDCIALLAKTRLGFLAQHRLLTLFSSFGGLGNWPPRLDKVVLFGLFGTVKHFSKKRLAFWDSTALCKRNNKNAVQSNKNHLWEASKSNWLSELGGADFLLAPYLVSKLRTSRVLLKFCCVP